MDGPPIPRLTTSRLVLREWRDDDREPFAELNADPRVSEFLRGRLDRAASDALVDRILDHWAANGHGLWAVERVEDGAFLGFVGLASHTFEAAFMPAVEVGWRLGPAAWGHGYATEAARAALRFGFEDLGLVEIVSFTVPENLRSRAVMERLGMTRDPADDFDHPRFMDDHRLRRHVLYRLKREDWARDPKSGCVTPVVTTDRSRPGRACPSPGGPSVVTVRGTGDRWSRRIPDAVTAPPLVVTRRVTIG